MSVDATPEQMRAIRARGGDVVVSAGAGSGKTFVLVGRFASLVTDDGLDPERILTITFTEKAAGEMRERIGKALAKAGVQDARRRTDGAWISTIHGFCARLLREHALEAGVDPGFGVLTDVPAARLRRKALLEAVRAFRGARPGLHDALVERVRWGKDQDGQRSISRRVLDLHDELRAAGARLALARDLGPEDPASLDALDLPQVHDALERLAGATRSYLAAAACEKQTPRLERQRAALRDLVERVAGAALDAFRPEVHRDLVALAEAARGSGPLEVELGRLREAALEAAGAWAEGPARALGRGLEELLRRFDERFRALKQAQSVLDFSDLEERARELLEDRPLVREAVQLRFQAVLVDEFQDTSRLQQRIVDLVRRPGAFFAVGDVKQSIYGFRHAEVRGLLEVQAEVERSGGDVVPLDVSFRTRPEVLGFVDEVFARAWAEPGSEVPHQPLRAGASFDPAVVESSAPPWRTAIELVVGRGESLDRARGYEARAVAARLATLIEGGALRGTNPGRPEAFGRPLRYRDCAILLPATTALAAYERALRERGVPYRVQSGRGFHASREVVDAVTILEVVADARDDLALAALLRSPAVGLSDAGLLALSKRRPERGPLGGKGALWDALSALADSEATGEGTLFDAPLDALDQARALRAHAVIIDLRARRGRASVRELLARGLEDTDLLDGALARTGDLRGHENLKKLLDVVEDLEREGASGPAEVAAILADLRDGGAREADAPVAGDDEDAVAVLTVHAAKGLEWPVVVVADCGRAQRPDGEAVLWCQPEAEGAAASPDEGFVSLVMRDADRPDLAVTPASMRAQHDLDRRRAREESKRLLYVAMTRTQEHLILAGAQGERATRSGDWLTWSRGPLAGAPERIAHALEADRAAGGVARRASTRAGLGVRYLEVGDDLDGAPMEGPRGPAAGARPVLDAVAIHALVRGERPRLPEVAPELADAAAALRGRVTAPRLPVRDDAPSVVTPSEVLTWTVCPRRALLEHVVRVEDCHDGGGGLETSAPVAREVDLDGVGLPSALGEIPADLFGTLVHEVLGQAERPSPARVQQRLEALLLPRTASPEALDMASGRALALLRDFEHSDLGRRAARAAVVERERSFLVALDGDAVRVANGDSASRDRASRGGVLLRGQADLLFQEHGGRGGAGGGPRAGWVLVEHKSTDVTALEVPQRLELPELQVRLYALALARMGPHVREAHVAFLAPDLACEVDVSPARLDDARDRLEAYVEARRTLDLPATPGVACRTCPHLRACPAGQASRVGGRATLGSFAGP